VQRLAAARNADVEAIRRMAVVGTPEQCVEQLLPYVKLGVGDFLVGARAPADLRTLELVARKIAPVVKEQAKSVLATR